MLYTQDFDIRTFDFWGQAEDNINTLRDNGLLSEVEDALEMFFADREETPL